MTRGRRENPTRDTGDGGWGRKSERERESVDAAKGGEATKCPRESDEVSWKVFLVLSQSR